MTAILLSTYNGSPYLEALFDSLEKQTDRTFSLIVRDDGSDDDTLERVRRYADASPLNIDIMPDGDNLGTVQSFSTLLQYALNETECDYFMFCDQDDVWLEDKVELTAAAMRKADASSGLPILVHTDLHVTDDDLNLLDDSFWHYENIDPSKNQLNRLLLQNTATGCTLMINRALARLASPIPPECLMHDWWLALTASVFGTIVPVSQKTVFYRQHADNRIGARRYDWRYKLHRGWQLLIGPGLRREVSRHHRQASAFLSRYGADLEEKSRTLLQAFVGLSERSWLARRWVLIRYGIFKHGLARNLALLSMV